MSFKIPGGPSVIVAEAPRECQQCHEIKECRPYGPDDTDICFQCAEKDIDAVERRMKRILFGE